MNAPTFETLEGRYGSIHVEQQHDGAWVAHLMARMCDDRTQPMTHLCAWARKSRSGALFVAKRVAQGFAIRVEDRVFVTPYMEA